MTVQPVVLKVEPVTSEAEGHPTLAPAALRLYPCTVPRCGTWPGRADGLNREDRRAPAAAGRAGRAGGRRRTDR